VVRKPEGKRPLGNANVDGRLILKWIFRIWEGSWNGLMWLGIETGGGYL